MSVNCCRICSGAFSNHHIAYDNMPRSAQELPSKNLPDRGIHFEVRQCTRCGTVQLTSNPVSYYKSVIRAAGFSPEMMNFRKKQFAGFIDKYNLQNIVEIGCGKGEYLSILSSLEIDAYGTEYSRKSANLCTKDGLYIQPGYGLLSGAFNSFCMFNFLEHCPNPVEMLNNIYNNTAHDTVGLIEVPNFDMMLQNGQFAEFITDHLFYFTKDTLRKLLERCGFEIIEYNTICDDYILSVVVKKISKIDLSKFVMQQIKITKEIIDYIGKFDTVGIYGAGHQAFTILSLIPELKDKTTYIIDDAPFKQDKCSPATHIPIISLESALTNLPDSIIIIAGGYSDEIYKKINFIKNIAILRPDRLEIR
jgi:hypothetical protein